MRLSWAVVIGLIGCDSPATQPDPPAAPSRASISKPASAAPPASAPGVTDPLAPRRPVQSVSAPALTGSAWVDARPPKDQQYERTARERGGILPCEAPDPGFGVHESWTHVRPKGHFIAPRRSALSADGGFDMVVHFHGHRPARKEFVRTGEDLVLLGVSLGIGVAYRPDFRDPRLLETMVTGVERKLSKRFGQKARLRRLGLTSWSRGFEAIDEILGQPLGKKVDAIMLFDSLHGSRKPHRQKDKLARFVAFARRAAKGETFFFASHSAIPTKDYASTTESVHFLIWKLGGVPLQVHRRDPLGLELKHLFSKGDFHARGYAGNGKLDHCAHFGVYPDAIRAVAARWRQRGTN